MAQPRKHDTPAQRQAAYRARTEVARRAQLGERGLPALPSIATLPGTARWKAALRDVAQRLATVQQEMQDYFSDRSEAWQDSERGEAHQQHLEAVEELLLALGDLEL